MTARIHRTRIWLSLACACTGWFVGPGSAAVQPAPAPWFADITRQAGVSFVHQGSAAGRYFMPDLMAGGVALLDADNDGRLDIYLVQGGGPSSRATNRLFVQDADGRFADASAGSGLDVSGHGQGVAVGDVDNDGLTDVIVTEYGATRLFVNKGRARFAEVTKQSGIDNPLWGTSACLLDYDRDAFLDLVVTNYVEYDSSKACSARAGQADFCGPSAFAGSVTKLYRNRGRRAAPSGAGRFEDATTRSGLVRLAGPGLGVTCVDFDGDGWQDIFVANDGQPNRLWINRRDGTFRDEALQRGIGYNAMGQLQAHMGIAIGDVDGDGLFDIFSTHLTEETHTLWTQDPRGSFQDTTVRARLTGRSTRGTGFGAVFADFDNDADLDLAYVNGRVTRDPRTPAASGAAFWQPYVEKNLLFANDGAARFRDVSPQNPAFSGPSGVFRGLAAGDLDNDGGVDLVVTAIDGAARVFRNVAAGRGHWLTVRALDPASKRDAYGAELTVRAGARRWVRTVSPGYSYLSSNDHRVHFGLGTSARVDAIEVSWPDGTGETFAGGPADQFVVVRKGQGTRGARSPVGSPPR